MSVSSISKPYSPVYNLDEILQDTLETTTEELPDIEETYQSYKEELDLELKTTDRVWLEFHAGFCEQFGKIAKSMLYRIVNSSIGCPENSIAAANAITILKVMRVSFSCIDLDGVQIPGADLSNAILDGADVSGANLENANLANASLNNINMLKANLKNVKFNIPNILIHEDAIFSCIVSPDNKYLISEDGVHMYFWNLSSKTHVKTIKKPSFLPGSDTYTFTPDSQFLFISNNKQHIDIWSVDDFEHIGKLKITDEEFSIQHFSFSPNGTQLITYSKRKFEEAYLTLWNLKKIENGLLIINLKSKIVPYETCNAYFSKKFPIFYLLNIESGVLKPILDIEIWNVETLSKVAHLSNIGECVHRDLISAIILTGFNSTPNNPVFSLDISNTSKSNEEHLFIAFGNSIYSMRILKKNEYNWALESYEITEVTTDIDMIYNMQILEKTHELIYVCSNTICLYSIKNNQHIGKFRLLDIPLRQLSVSSDETNIYISYLNKVFIHSIDALKKNKYISYELDSKVSRFSSDSCSIISLSNGFYITEHDIETGNRLKSNFLQKSKSHIYRQIDKILFATHMPFMLIRASRSIYIINTEKDAVYLEIPVAGDLVDLSSNSKYVAFMNYEKTLTIYRTTSSQECIGHFSLESTFNSQIAITTDFDNTPKVALVCKNNSKLGYEDNTYSNKINVCNFIFRNEILELLSQQELSVEEDDILQLMFTENNSKLIVACRKKVILWNIEENFHEEHDIQASCGDISQDGSLLIYYDNNGLNTARHQLCLWSITQKQPLIILPLSLEIAKLQISPDNRYILATAKSGSMYVWKTMENTLRLLWRTSHDLQTQELTLGDNKLEKDVEDELVKKMGAIKL